MFVSPSNVSPSKPVGPNKPVEKPVCKPICLSINSKYTHTPK